MITVSKDLDPRCDSITGLILDYYRYDNYLDGLTMGCYTDATRDGDTLMTDER